MWASCNKYVRVATCILEELEEARTQKRRLALYRLEDLLKRVERIEATMGRIEREEATIRKYCSATDEEFEAACEAFQERISNAVDVRLSHAMRSVEADHIFRRLTDLWFRRGQ